MNIVYPKWLSFLNKGPCSVCAKEGNDNIHVMNEHFLGWTSCNTDDCKKVIHDWYKNTSKTQDDLVSQFGFNKVNIKRSNNKLESGWIIDSDARQEQQDGDYWVKVRYKNNSKEVKLSDMIEWNNV